MLRYTNNSKILIFILTIFRIQNKLHKKIKICVYNIIVHNALPLEIRNVRIY